MTSPFPAPDRHRCPLCGAALTTSQCNSCGAELAGPGGEELWAVDNQLYQLSLRRRALAARLAVRPPPPPWAAPAAGPQPPSVRPLPPMMAPGGPSLAVAPAPGPEVSSILLALGVTLLVVAALVFAVVSWDHLGAVGQGALLVGLTLVVGFATDRAARRRLTGTAEALGVLTVVLGPLVAQAVRITVNLPATNDRTWANAINWSWWPFALMVIGVAAIGFGRRVGVRSAQHLGVVLVQVGLPVWVVLAPVPVTVMAGVLVGQAALVALGPLVWQRTHPTAGTWALGSVVAWGLGLMLAVGSALQFNLGTAEHVWSAVALAMAAVSAAAVAWRWRAKPILADPAALGATAALLLASGRLLAGWVPDVTWWPILGFGAALGLALANRFGGARAVSIRTVCWLAAAVAAIPVADGTMAVMRAAGAAGVAGAPWRHVALAAVVTDTGFGLAPAWASSLAGIGAIAAAVVAEERRLGRPMVARALVALAMLAVLVVPALAGGSVAVVTLVTLAAAVGLGAAAWQPTDRRLLAAVSLAVLAFALVWAAGNAGLVLVVGAAAVVLGLVAVVRGNGVGDVSVAVGGALLAAFALPAEVGWAAWALGTGPAWSWAVASMTAAVVGVVLVPVGRRLQSAAEGGAEGAAAAAAAAGAAVLVLVHVGALGSIGPAGPVAVEAAVTAALVVGVVALAVVAASLVRLVRSWWLWAVAAGVEAVVLVWLRLADSNVSTVEAYTAPVAVLLAGATVLGAWASAGRSWAAVRSRPSWSLEGPALAMAVGPTALVALGDPGLTRQVIGLSLGAILVAVGAALRRRAQLDIGAATVVVLGLQALLPYAADVPRWISLGAAGAVLVALGATFEERRKDLNQAKRRYAALR